MKFFLSPWLFVKLMTVGVAMTLSTRASVTCHATTVIVDYRGGTDPTPQGWSNPVRSTNVLAGTYDDNGTAVWRIYDSGMGRPETTDPANNLYYQKSVSATLLTDILTNGWEINARLSVAMNDPAPGGGALSANGDSWVGIVYNNPNGSGTRLVFGFNAGRTAQGQMMVSVNGLSGSARNFDAGYQDVKMVYDPSTQLASAYINDLFIGSYSGASTSAGSNVMYWGDNSAQNSPTTARVTYYDSVSFIMVPEPSNLAWCGFGALLWTMLSRRRNPRSAF